MYIIFMQGRSSFERYVRPIKVSALYVLVPGYYFSIFWIDF